MKNTYFRDVLKITEIDQYTLVDDADILKQASELPDQLFAFVQVVC